MTLNAVPPDRRFALTPLDEKADHVRGSPAGRLIIEYGDYECPYSRQAFHAIEQARTPAWEERAVRVPAFPADPHPPAHPRRGGRS
jgi:protein-disulfide isomerase